MRLTPQIIPKWPKLSWVAILSDGSDKIDVLHGPMVEVSREWLAEAVWAGDFQSGDFDRTDLVFGSGVRCRSDRITFVSAGTAMDRLWYCEKNNIRYISNSMGALCACAEISLVETHNYVQDRQSEFRTTWGAKKCTRTLTADPVNIHLIWYNNLVYDGNRLYEEEKPDTAPEFRSFNDYFRFLTDTAEALKNNLNASERQHRVDPIATVSSGYDSPAAAVISKYAGCTQALTIKQSSSFWRGSDSGRNIADHLGMSCTSCNRTAKAFPHEAAFWAASGWANLLNWTLFPYPQGVCLLFQGNYGDAVWNRRPLPDPFNIEIWDDLAMGEFRLIVGMLQCPVPFWGIRHAREINAITFSDEMQPWVLNRAYDRPIPRRIVEEAGIARTAFAVRKKDTSHEIGFRWPYSKNSQAAFRQFLRCRSISAPGPLLVSLIRKLSLLESLLHQNIFRKVGIRKRFRPWRQIFAAGLLFQWANHEVKSLYMEGSKDIDKVRSRSEQRGAA